MHLLWQLRTAAGCPPALPAQLPLIPIVCHSKDISLTFWALRNKYSQNEAPAWPDTVHVRTQSLVFDRQNPSSVWQVSASSQLISFPISTLVFKSVCSVPLAVERGLVTLLSCACPALGFCCMCRAHVPKGTKVSSITQALFKNTNLRACLRLHPRPNCSQVSKRVGLLCIHNNPVVWA